MSRRSEGEMSPAEFLADVEVAVTDRSVVLPRPGVGVDNRDELLAAAGESQPAHKFAQGA